MKGESKSKDAEDDASIDVAIFDFQSVSDIAEA
jgi:hypothetical protein